MCTVGLLVSYLCILEVFVSTFALLLYRQFTCAYLLHFWNDQSEQHQPSYSQKMISLLGHALIFAKKNVETYKNYDALLMQFWCNFETTSFWCTFDVVSKGFDALLMWFQNCTKAASKVHHVFWWFSAKFEEKYVEMYKKYDALLMQFWNYIILMHFWCSFKGFWCTFDAVSKLHQNCIKSASCF